VTDGIDDGNASAPKLSASRSHPGANQQQRKPRIAQVGRLSLVAPTRNSALFSYGTLITCLTLAMDPVSSIGLASSAAQLITFASDLISKSREIYHSADGSLVKNDELGNIARTLQSQSRLVRVRIGEQRAPSETGKELFKLCDAVRDVSQELIDAIESLRSESSSSTWRSFRQALKSVWKERDIEELLRRLEQYRRQIDSLLLMNLQERLQLFTETTSDRNAKIDDNFQKMRSMIPSSHQWQKELIETARDALHAPKRKDSHYEDSFAASLSAGAKMDRETLLRRRMIATLSFPDMRDRYERIPEAHQKTFDWVFHEDNSIKFDNFVDWLRSNNSLYWITGKPGAGKSTLMKYISHDPRLQHYLKVWQAARPLRTARFFFWNSGSKMQMSRVGLMQSLLQQTLSESPEAIARVFPERWEYQELFGYNQRPWTWSELSDGFRNLISDTNTAFYFLIDGLDEFDGDCSELAHFLLEILSNGRDNVKMCLASRPWLVFEDAFRRRPSLRVEDLTLQDIHTFVVGKLAENVMFSRLQEHDGEKADVLIKDVTLKASGVFLWVRLAVKSLMDGLRDGDTVEDLQARLLLIPPDLDRLFQKILGDLDAAYLEEASLIFQAVHASYIPGKEISLSRALEPPEIEQSSKSDSVDAWSPLTLLSLSFINEDPYRVFDSKYDQPLSREDQTYRGETMRRRLISRCKGLLEAPTFKTYGPEAKVHYLHRTVKDFFDEDRARMYLTQHSTDFKPHIALLSALLRHTQATRPNQDGDTQDMQQFGENIYQFVVQCLWIERQGSDEYVAFLDKMSQLTPAILGYDSETNRELPHWTKRVDPFVGQSTKVYCMVDYAVVRGLIAYVEQKCESGYRFKDNKNWEYLVQLTREKQGNERMAKTIEQNVKGAGKRHKKQSKKEASQGLQVPGETATSKKDKRSSFGFRDKLKQLASRTSS
jgi:hypothetical protein